MGKPKTIIFRRGCWQRLSAALILNLFVSTLGMLRFGDGTIVWLKGFGEIKVFRASATDGASEDWATSLRRMTKAERKTQAMSAWRIEMYHRALNRQCLIERAQVRRWRPVINHVGLCIRAFVRIESHCYRKRISWMQAKTSIIRDAVRAYLSNPRYLLLPTA